MLDIKIPYRITLYGEKPVERSYWFDAEFTSDWQSIRSLCITFLKQQKISYIQVLGKLWFLFNGAWCTYDYELMGNRVKFYIQEYIQN